MLSTVSSQQRQSSFGDFFAKKQQQGGGSGSGVMDATTISNPTAVTSHEDAYGSGGRGYGRRGGRGRGRGRGRGGRGGGEEDGFDDGSVPPPLSAPPGSSSFVAAATSGAFDAAVAAGNTSPRRRRLVSAGNRNFGTATVGDGIQVEGMADDGSLLHAHEEDVIGVDKFLDKNYVLDGRTDDIEHDKYDHIRFKRFDSSPEANLSVDVPFKKLRDSFNDYDARRCLLCNESIQMWNSHCNFVPHAGREAIMLELLRPYCGTPEEILKVWWYRLDTSKQFRRIRELSDENPSKRKKKLRYLLQFLRERKVLRECFDVFKTASNMQSAGRSWEFERLEWCGDNVVKYIFNNRMTVLFPVHEGGVKQKLGFVQSLIDGNDGLARAYDYLDLHQLTNSDRIVSKFKSDVIEAIFGELQVYLWSTELDEGVEVKSYPITLEMIPLRQLVWHCMEELAHCMIMMHCEYVCQKLMKAVKMLDAKFVKSNPEMRSIDPTMRSNSIAAAYVQKKDAYQLKPTDQKVTRPFSLALTMHHMVMPLGGFLNEDGTTSGSASGGAGSGSGSGDSSNLSSSAAGKFLAWESGYLPQLQVSPSPVHHEPLKTLQQEYISKLENDGAAGEAVHPDWTVSATTPAEKKLMETEDVLSFTQNAMALDEAAVAAA